MKKLCLLIVCIFLGCVCFSEESAAPDKPALSNPRNRYEEYYEDSDGSERTIFTLLDKLNDERALVEIYGSLTAKIVYFDESGNEIRQDFTTLKNSEAGSYLALHDGKTMLSKCIYMFEDALYHTIGESLVKIQENPEPDAVSVAFDTIVFPCAQLSLLNGIRTDENGYTYYLAACTNGSQIEYVTKDASVITEIRQYTVNETGDMTLFCTVNFSYNSSLSLPEAVLADRIPAE